MITQDPRVVRMSDFVGERRHAVDRSRKRHENPRLLVSADVRAKTALTFSAAVLDFDPAFADRHLSELAKVRAEG